jgi:VWFA-related protein
MHLRFLLVLSFAGVVFGGQAQQDPVISTTTRLVTVDVVVRDKQGNPVQSLSQSDFSLLDNGKPQNLKLFRRSDFNGLISAAAQRMQLPAELPPGLHSNLASSKSSASSVTVILFDALNTPIEDQRNARQQMLRFLEQLRPDDRVGLYILSNRLHILHDITSDAKSLVQKLTAYRGDSQANLDFENSLAPLLNDQKLQKILSDPGEAERAQSQIVADQNVALIKLTERIQRTFQTLEAIAQHMAEVPGRKNLLWVSAAFPMVVGTDLRTGTGSPASFAYIADQATKAIANAGVAIYPIDARGVMVDTLYRAKSRYSDYAMAQVVGASRSRGARRGPRATFTSPDPMVYADRDETVAHHDIMEEIAKRTGGRAFYDSNDTSRQIRAAMDDNSGNYVLGYYPDPYEDNGRFRKIQVKVQGQGLSIRHREGYFARDEAPTWTQQQREAMWDLMAGPLEVGGIAIAAQCQQAEGKLKVTMRLDPDAISLRNSAGFWVGQIQLALFYVDATGKSIGGTEQSLPLRLTNDDREKMLSAGGLNYGVELPMQSNATRLVIGARDLPSGRLGTIHIKMDQFKP